MNYLKKYNWSDKQILIVEDDISSLFLLKEIIRETGAEMLFAENGNDAINICKSESDLSAVLMDIQIPGMDGYEATQGIRKFRPKLPIIAQTAYGLADEKDKCLNSGCNDYISKPIDPKNLLLMISKYLKPSN